MNDCRHSRVYKGLVVIGDQAVLFYRCRVCGRLLDEWVSKEEALKRIKEAA